MSNCGVAEVERTGPVKMGRSSIIRHLTWTCGTTLLRMSLSMLAPRPMLRVVLSRVRPHSFLHGFLAALCVPWTSLLVRFRSCAVLKAAPFLCIPHGAGVLPSRVSSD